MSTPQYFIDEVVADRDWRMRELEFIKKLDKKVLYNQLGEGELKVYYRMCIPTVYAHWEGFISTSFKNLIEILNKKSLLRCEVINEIFAFSQKKNFQTLAGKQSFKQRCEFSEKFILAYSQPIKIDAKLLDTKSNLRYEVLEEILSWFNINIDPYLPYKQDINKLVNTRNAIAHGENSVIISYLDLEKYIKKVNELFDITIVNLAQYVTMHGYKRTNCIDIN